MVKNDILVSTLKNGVSVMFLNMKNIAFGKDAFFDDTGINSNISSVQENSRRMLGEQNIKTVENKQKSESDK